MGGGVFTEIERGRRSRGTCGLQLVVGEFQLNSSTEKKNSVSCGCIYWTQESRGLVPGVSESHPEGVGLEVLSPLNFSLP